MLGSSGSLSPNVAAFPVRNSSLLSPSASSISVNSSTSASQQSTDAQDLSSKISLGQSDENVANANEAGTPLACPICNEEMVRLVYSSTLLRADGY